MGRKTSKEDIEKIICNLRTEIPNITIRTTLICGFPGETQAMHRELLSFIKEMHFDRLGAFPYSQEENTPAASFEHQVLEKTKNIWYQEVMEVQQTISLANQNKFIGQTLEAFIEGKIADEDVYLARTYRDAPNVDGYVFIHTTTDFISGDFVTVKITQCNEYDLIGEIVS